MSEKDLIEAFKILACSIKNDESKEKLLTYIACVVQKIESKENHAADYVEDLLKELK
ncbi:MAG: hypothetical protein IKM97_03895 [Clostridia bacterium]|nr:hypothetical protein [Clostridia bacterium]